MAIGMPRGYWASDRVPYPCWRYVSCVNAWKRGAVSGRLLDAEVSIHSWRIAGRPALATGRGEELAAAAAEAEAMPLAPGPSRSSSRSSPTPPPTSSSLSISIRRRQLSTAAPADDDSRRTSGESSTSILEELAAGGSR